MYEEDMIGIPTDDAPAAGAVVNDNGQPAQPAGDLEGVLLDNDEQQDENPTEVIPTGDGGPQEDGKPQGQGADSALPSTEVREEPDDAGTDKGSKEPVSQPAPELVADPGEFQPKDYSFEVELADGTKHRIGKPEDIDNLPEAPQFATLKEHTQFITNYTKMVNGIDADQREYEAEKAKFDEVQKNNADVEQRVTTMLNEMSYLETKGKLPQVADEFKEADWSNPKVAEQPGVKERLALLEYRHTENQERTKLGLSPMSVIEAHMQMQQEAVVAAEAEAKQKAADLRKAKGAMISGPSSVPTNGMPDDMIIGEGGSTRDIGL